MKSKIIKFSAAIILLLIIVLLLPFPQIISTELSASIYDDPSSEYTLSVKAVKLNYLIKTDEFIPKIKLYNKDNIIFDNSSDKIKIPLLKFPSQNKEKNIEYADFFFYDKQKNIMDTASLIFDNSKGYFSFTVDNLTYTAPSQSKKEADNIINYLEISNFPQYRNISQ
ncbi:MAG: hypothetical protein Q4F63_09315 [Clostridia bacterium]|nr:hypothetical protein [Clostridia bacterium]